MKLLKYFFVLISLTFVLFGCRIANPSVMLRTPKDFKFEEFPEKPDSQYVIAVDDVVRMRLMANDGIRLIDVIGAERMQQSGSGNMQQQSLTAGEEYTVEYDGTIKLPVVGRFKIAGLKQRAAEDSLEKIFSKVYKDPFIQLSVSNKRVIIFPGGLGTAKVIPLVNPNLTLFEALALAGGIDPDGKAYRIKLIRGNLKKPYVFLIDASSIETIKNADLILQADDIIYVEPVERPSRFFARDIAPWISIVTSTLGLALTIYALTQIAN